MVAGAGTEHLPSFDGGGGYDAADKVAGVVSCGHTDGRDQVPGRGYSLTTFRVVSCVHPNRNVVPGAEVHACLGRNVYVLWSSSRRGAPATVDAFRAASPLCIVLERGAGELRVASEEEGAAGSGLHTNRLLFLRGKERSSTSSVQGMSDVRLLLEAPSAGICTSWAMAGGSLLTPWEALVGASLSGWSDATAVHELLMSALPPLPVAADDQLSTTSRILGRRGRHFVLHAQHWLAPSASVGLNGASAVGQVADAVDQVRCVPVVGPVLRLCLLVVQVGALAVLADGHDARRKDAVQRCEAIALDVLCRIFEQLRKDPTEFGAAFIEQLCSLMAQVEIILEQVEATFFMTPVMDMMADALVHGWEQQLKDIHDKQIISSVHSAVGRAVDRVEHSVDGMMRRVSELGRSLAGSLPVEQDLSMYEVGWRPPVLDEDHVAGVHKHGRVEFDIVSMLEGYASGEATKAPRVGVYGIDGCGKSTACAEVATCERVRALFPRGTIWVQLNETSTSETVVAAVLALVYHLCGEAAVKRCLRLTGRKDFVAMAASDVQASLMADMSKWLVIVDDVRYEQVGMLKQLLLVVSRATPVLFTTRSEVVVTLVSGAARLAISSWPEEDARALLARAIGKTPSDSEPVFSAEEETAWVQRVLDLTQRHVLSVSIVAALLSAHCGKWRPVVAALEHQWTDPSFQRPLTDLNPMRSVRATLDTSRVLLPDDEYRRAFAAVGILPANEQIGMHVLGRLWRPQLGVVGGAAEVSSLSRPPRPCVGGEAVHPGALRLVDALVRAGLIHQEVADGDLAGAVVHPVVCGYAHSLLGADIVAAHQRLLDEYARDCPADGTDTHGWLGYHFWATADDGYWYNNVARHAAASEDVLALASLVTDEWYAARARTSSLAGHEADVGLVLASLSAIIDDADHSVHESPVLLGAAHWGLAMAFLHRKGCMTAANQEAAFILLRRGLDEVSRAAAPSLWAEMQNDLGNVYSYRVNGDKAANFQKAVRCYYHALEVRTHETLAWAETQHCLGMAYADRDGGDKAANMEEALAYFRRSLDVRARHVAPLQWADTNLHMGAAYTERVDGGKAANMEEAMACYRRALEVWTRETVPLYWATAQHSMGRAYTERVDGDKAANLEEAVACYRRALLVRTRDAVPLPWTTTQRCLGLALAERVEGDKTVNLKEAVACFRRVVDVRTRETMPLEWAAMQLKLADIYKLLMDGDKDAKQANKEEMMACYRRTLVVWTRETAPNAWAETQNRMGVAYAQVVDGDKAANLEEAVACHQRALDVWTREAAPLHWATTQVYLAHVFKLQVSGDKEANKAKMEQMKACFRCALEVWTRESAPTSWADTLYGMGTACALWVGGDEAANMEEAVACYRRVLEVWTREAAPLEWTTTQLNLAFALRRQASSDAAANMEEALACYRNALEIVTRGYDAQLWAKVQFSMGTAYAERVYGDKAANWEEAVACYRRALEVRTREEIPQLWANTTWRMVIALQGAEHWVEALERARALQAFGCEWNKWDEMEASLVTRVAQLEPEVALPSNSRTVSDPLPGVDDDGLAA
ncbi:hypothetical protein BU14_0238s0005 [Porphyra umbilicalis]|uniref:NB-ARC domain-containing protein n=1 Tax=Porphyra umbilicalis TaxID=2786 RepID=A0A1X6P3A2_PORUM|nr:hypothetical protein BU14_0238s0005 [Porphyra umbilicalis]|eukprot:OSX75382.1 hypothetical protein BU14_0238s0005 [Porphyra umbilicalis]